MVNEPVNGSPGALDGVRVLDLTHYIAGPFCTKLLADYGADVLKIERPPAGDPARRLGPFFHDIPHLEGSALFLHLNTNKRSLELNLKSEEGRAILRRLLPSVDIVVENFRPVVMDRLGLGYQQLAAINPGVVLTSISNFGQSGPYRDLKATEITEYAMGGAMNATGHRDHEPLKLGGNVVQYHAGAVAAYATLLALYRAEDDGEGEHIDVSIYETEVASRDRRTIYLTAYAYTGDTSRRPEVAIRPLSGVRPALDGYVSATGGGPRLANALRMMGRDDLVDEPRFRDPQRVRDPEVAGELEELYLSWLGEHTKYEAVAIAQAHNILSAPVNTIADLFADPHFQDRNPWDVIDHPHTGPVTYSGRPFIMHGTPRAAPRPAPLLGEHNQTVLCDELQYAREDLRRLREEGVI